MNARRTFRRGVIYYNLFVGKFAADQQHKIDRSVGVELAATGKRDFMEEEVQARLPFDIVRDDFITRAAGAALLFQDFVAFKHGQAALGLIVADSHCLSDVSNAWRGYPLAFRVDERPRRKFFIRCKDQRYSSPAPDHFVQLRVRLNVAADPKAGFI